ncbi:MAG: Protein involved in biosynthesis of mitomycin antibiotics/polyketide fumonisin [Myxococcales bacterium]|nr:Protein involved in biosynthesis of mitomycin antibiotics/polyketide fumonisin [Myxococcales bacterium]
MDWARSLITQGYVHFRRLVPDEMVEAARALIEEDLRHNYDATREDEYSSGTYCPAILDAAAITDLLHRSPVRGIVDAALGFEAMRPSGPQVAIRWAHNVDREFPPEPHIDAVLPDRIANFTATVGIFLTTTPRTFAGNLTVWPGTHRSYEAAFRQRGPRSVFEPLPEIDLGKPHQLLCEAGDVVVMHWSLAHSAAVNTSDVDRLAVYFRLGFPELDADTVPDLGEGRWQYLANLWRGWRIADSS